MINLNGLQFPKPMDHATYYNMGLVYAQTGQIQKAKSRWLAMTRLVPEYTASWINLGAMYAQEAQYEKSADCMQKVLAMGTDDPRIEKILALLREDRDGGETLTRLARDAYRPADIALPMTRVSLSSPENAK